MADPSHILLIIAFAIACAVFAFGFAIGHIVAERQTTAHWSHIILDPVVSAGDDDERDTQPQRTQRTTGQPQR